MKHNKMIGRVLGLFLLSAAAWQADTRATDPAKSQCINMFRDSRGGERRRPCPRGTIPVRRQRSRGIPRHDTGRCLPFLVDKSPLSHRSAAFWTLPKYHVTHRPLT